MNTFNTQNNQQNQSNQTNQASDRQPFQDPNYDPRRDPAERYVKELARIIDGELDRLVPDNMSKWFGSIEYRPRSMFFGTQNEGEKVYLLVRRHWIKNLGWIVNNIIYSIAPILILLVLERFNVDITFISFKVFFIIVLAYYSIIFTNVLRNFYDWYFDVYIVTNERVLEYEFKPFVSYKVTEAELGNIEDVEESGKGIVADLFNYGDLIIRTASRHGEIAFDAIPDPTRVRDILMNLVEVIEDYRNASNRP